MLTNRRGYPQSWLSCNYAEALGDAGRCIGAALQARYTIATGLAQADCVKASRRPGRSRPTEEERDEKSFHLATVSTGAAACAATLALTAGAATAALGQREV